jgi:hypothetical protein
LRARLPAERLGWGLNWIGENYHDIEILVFWGWHFDYAYGMAIEVIIDHISRNGDLQLIR